MDCIETHFPLLKLKSNEIEGRYLVAATDIKQGDLILEEYPVVRCPPYTTKPLCLGCYTHLDTLAQVIHCPDCNWPMCSKECCKNEDHLLECQLCKQAGFKVNSSKLKYDKVEPIYDILTILRMFALKNKHPKKWEKLSSLMSHLDEWKKDATWVKEHEPACKDILDNFDIKGLDRNMILTLFGIGYVNDFSAPINDSTRIRIAYPFIAMISHDCTPNCIRYISGLSAGNKMLCYASRDISKGDKLSITYVDLIQPTFMRKDILLKSKHFECICQKCLDPTELGSQGSSIKCQKCSNGYLIPPKWICDGKCKKATMTNQKAEEIIRKAAQGADELMSDTSQWTVKNFEKYLKEHEKVLHPCNLSMVRVKNSLVGFYGRTPGFEMQKLAMSPALMDRKEALATEVLAVLDLIEPGLSPAKGILLFELHLPLFIRAQVGLSMGTMDISEALEAFKESLQCLEKSMQHLKFEVEGSFGYELKLGAEDSHQQLQNVIQQVENAA